MADYRAAAAQIARRYGIPPQVFAALIGQESGWRAAVRSPAGAIGLGQLMPGTARGLGVNPLDPMQNLEGSARYLSQQLKRFGRLDLALAAYNAGPGAVQKYGGIPPYAETANYVRSIMGAAGGAGAAAAPAYPAAPSPGVGVSPSSPPAAGLSRAALSQLARIRTQAERGVAPTTSAIARLRSLRPTSVGQATGAVGAVVQETAGNVQGGAVPFAAAPDYSWASQLAKQFGLGLASTYRDPGKNASVGGSRTSRHMTRGAATDFSGSPEAMRRFADWAMKSGLFAEVFYDPLGQFDNGRFSPRGIGGHGDHAHASLGAPGLRRFYGGGR